MAIAGAALIFHLSIGVGCSKPEDLWSGAHGRFLARFRANRPFSFARYNDGEWSAIRDWIETIQPAYHERAQALDRASLRPSYRGDFIARAWACKSPFGMAEYHQCSENISRTMFRALTGRTRVAPPNNKLYIFQSGLYWEDWREDYAKWGLRVEFQREDIIHHFVRSDVAGLEAWVDTLRPPNGHTVLVGPCSYRALMRPLGVQKFLEIPRLHANAEQVTLTLERTEAELRHYLSNAFLQGVVVCVLLSAGMLSNIIIENMFDWSGGRFFFIDIGSAFDPLLDHPSVALFRRMPGGSPARVRKGFMYPGIKALRRLKRLLPKYRSRSNAALRSLLARTWLGLDGRGLDTINITMTTECSHSWTSNLYSIAEKGDPRSIRAVAWLFKRGKQVSTIPLRTHKMAVKTVRKFQQVEIRETGRDSDHFGLAQTLHERGQLAEAKRLYQKSTAARYAEPDTAAMAHWRLRDVATQTGDVREAETQRLLAEQHLRLLGILEI